MAMPKPAQLFHHIPASRSPGKWCACGKARQRGRGDGKRGCWLLFSGDGPTDLCALDSLTTGWSNEERRKLKAIHLSGPFMGDGSRHCCDPQPQHSRGPCVARGVMSGCSLVDFHNLLALISPPGASSLSFLTPHMNSLFLLFYPLPGETIRLRFTDRCWDPL